MHAFDDWQKLSLIQQEPLHAAFSDHLLNSMQVQPKVHLPSAFSGAYSVLQAELEAALDAAALRTPVALTQAVACEQCPGLRLCDTTCKALHQRTACLGVTAERAS